MSEPRAATLVDAGDAERTGRVVEVVFFDSSPKADDAAGGGS